MARLTNTPQQPTLLCLERSKSFSMAVRVYKETPSKQRQALDITGATLQFVMAEPSRLGGSVVIDQALELLSANVGYARLNLQAAALTLPADEEYSFIIRLIEAGGYSRVLIKGEVEVIDNTDDFDSNVYEHSANTQGLSAVLRGDQTVHVFLNGGEGESIFVESQLQVGEQTFAEPDEDPDMSIADGVLAVRWPAPGSGGDLALHIDPDAIAAHNARNIQLDIDGGGSENLGFAVNHLNDFVNSRATLLNDHIFGSESVHPASAISYAGGSSLPASTVEAAIDSLDARTAGGSGGGGGGDIPPEVTWDVSGVPGLHVSGEAGLEAWVTADTIGVGSPGGGLATLSPGSIITTRSGHDETTGVTYSSAVVAGGDAAGTGLFLSTNAEDAETSWSGSLLLTHPVDGESFLRAPVEGAEEAPATIATREWVETVTGPAGSGLVRSDVAGAYAYMGTAPVGLADADDGWTVARIHLTGHTTTTGAGAWDDRLTLTYT